MAENITPREVTAVRYLDYAGLTAVWDKIRTLYERKADLVKDLTTFGEGQIITSQDGTFIQKGIFDNEIARLDEALEDIIVQQGNSIDKDTIVEKDGHFMTNLILRHDYEAKTISLVTDVENGGKGTVVNTISYEDFYNDAVKDGILNKVSLVYVPSDGEPESADRAAGTYMKFEFNTASGQQPIYLDVDDLLGNYVGGDYIQIDRKRILDTEEDEVTISLNTVELVDYLKTDSALGINSILTRLEGAEDRITEIEQLSKDLESISETLKSIEDQITGLNERVGDMETQITEINEVLATVPSQPITQGEIDALQ